MAWPEPVARDDDTHMVRQCDQGGGVAGLDGEVLEPVVIDDAEWRSCTQIPPIPVSG